MSLEQYERVLEVAGRAGSPLPGRRRRPPRGRAGERGRAAQVPGSEASRTGRGPGEGGRGAGGCRGAGAHSARQPALLRVRDRRDAAGRARRGLAGRRLGSDCEPLRLRPLGRGGGGGLGALGARGPRPADGRRASASRPVARWRTSPGSPPGGTLSSSGPAGTSRPRASTAPRRCGCSSASTRTRRSSWRFGCWGSALRTRSA